MREDDGVVSDDALGRRLEGQRDEVALDAEGIHPLLGGRLRCVGVPPDVINQPIDQIIIQPPVAMVGEGQHLDPHEVLVELFQPEDRVVHGERRIILTLSLEIWRWGKSSVAMSWPGDRLPRR
jgi:hypothetical protein